MELNEDAEGLTAKKLAQQSRNQMTKSFHHEGHEGFGK
jgi:hypothetical protein